MPSASLMPTTPGSGSDTFRRKMSDAYAGQDRGSTSDYDRYLRGMDASMRQKVALTAAHLLAEGQVADMGMGSGAGSHALAALYPQLRVVGVDIDPKMVERAAATHRLPNLRFIAGDIAAPCFPDGTVEAMLDSVGGIGTGSCGRLLLIT